MARITAYPFKDFLDGTEVFVLVAEGATYKSDPDTMVGSHERRYPHDEFLTKSTIPRTLITDVYLVASLIERDALPVSDGTTEGVWEGDVVIVNDGSSNESYIFDSTDGYLNLGYNNDIIVHESTYDHDLIGNVLPLNSLDSTAILTDFNGGVTTMQVSTGGFPGTGSGDVLTTKPSNVIGTQRFSDDAGGIFFRSYNSGWNTWTAVGNVSRSVFNWVADNTTGIFDTTGATTTDISMIDVWVNGLKLVRTAEYEISGASQITITYPAITVSDDVEIIIWE